MDLSLQMRTWEDNIKTELQGTGWVGGVGWIYLGQDRGRWRPLVKTVTNLRVHPPSPLQKKYGEFLDKLSFKSCILKDCSMERCVTSYRGTVLFSAHWPTYALNGV